MGHRADSTLTSEVCGSNEGILIGPLWQKGCCDGLSSEALVGQNVSALGMAAALVTGAATIVAVSANSAKADLLSQKSGSISEHSKG